MLGLPSKSSRGLKEDLPPGYTEIKCHIIFDVKMGENFRRKARQVAGGHVTEVPPLIAHSSVVPVIQFRLHS